jgi:hypothetical protein
MTKSAKKLNDEQLNTLHRIAAMGDSAPTEGERDNARSLLLKKILAFDVNMVSLAKALEHFQGREAIDEALEELTNTVENLSEQLQQREAELTKKSAENARLEDENKYLKKSRGPKDSNGFFGNFLAGPPGIHNQTIIFQMRAYRTPQTRPSLPAPKLPKKASKMYRGN